MQDILSDLTVTRVRSVFNLLSQPGKTMERSSRPCFAIIYKYEGETEYECGGRRILSNRENAVVLPAGSSYTWQVRKSGHYYDLEFEADATIEGILSFPVGAEGEKLLRMMREAERRQNLRAAGYKLEGMRAVYSMLLLLLGSQRKGYADASHRERIAPALDYIAEHYNESIRNDALAALCGISTVYLRKLFSRITGQSPIGYLHTLRIAKAKKMLESDYRSLTEIALALGYADIYSFSKAFKSRTGLTPTAYAAQCRGDTVGAIHASPKSAK